MVWSLTYAELKGWQSGIAALLGFGALLVGALWNFRLTRRRDAALRREEAASIAAALYGEILLLRAEAASLARVVATAHIAMGNERDPIVKIDAYLVAAHQLRPPVLYIALAPRLGSLPADMIIGITSFYGDLQDARHWFPLLVDSPGRGYGHSVVYVLKPLLDAVYDIRPTLRAIEKLAKIERLADDPGVGDAEKVVAIENEMYAASERD
jgi:hypothetical protein